MIEKEVINEEVFVAQTTYYVYIDEHHRDMNRPLITTSDKEYFEILKRKSRDKMEFLDIDKVQPSKFYCRCQVITDKGRTLDVDYYDEWGIFWDDDGNEIGWKDNGENPELVIKWREIKFG